MDRWKRFNPQIYEWIIGINPQMDRGLDKMD